MEYSQKKYEEQLADYEVPPECLDASFKGECHANHIRKMQSSFAWDWGPAFPSMGVWSVLVCLLLLTWCNRSTIYCAI